MVEIKKRKIRKQEYFYLEHSFRDGKKVMKKHKYLGKEIPKNIEELKVEFISELYKDKWIKDIESIRENFSKEYESMPRSAKEKERETFAIKFTYNSQRIEGSTLTLKETANLLERGISPAKPIRDIREAESHKKVFDNMIDYDKDLNLNIVTYWNRLLLEETKSDIAGRIRNHQIALARSKFAPPFPAELDTLLHEFFKWYAKNKDKLHPVELAALVYLKFVTIHPFGDGNGRVSRIMMNFVLKKNGYPLLDIPYEKRNSYYNALERAQVRKEESIFLQWFFKRYVQEHKRYLR